MCRQVWAFFGFAPVEEQSPPCGGYTCDQWIEWDPKKYSCQELERDYGCDCKGCKDCKAERLSS
jgi:hypothetical protein